MSVYENDYRANFCVYVNGRATWMRHVPLNNSANTVLGAKRQAYRIAKRINASRIEFYYSPNPCAEEGVYWRALATRLMSSHKWESYV